MKVAAHLTLGALFFAVVGAAQAQNAGYATAGSGLLSKVSAGRFTVAQEEEMAKVGVDCGAGCYEGCDSGACGDPCGDSCYDPCVCPAWIGSIDYLSWKPRRGGFDFAAVDPVAGNGIVEGGRRSLEYEADSGIRVNVGRLFSSGWDITFTYTNFHSDDAQLATAPGGGQVAPTRGALAGIPMTSVAGSAILEMDDFAFEAGYWFFPYRSVSLRVFGGVRGATVHQRMFVDAQGGALPAGGSQVMQASQVDALGIRMGGETHWYFGENVSIFGRAAGSVLMGDFGTAYAETNRLPNVPNVSDVNVTDAYWQMVPVMEVAGGVNVQRGPWSIQAGYELSTWFNLALEEDITRAALPGIAGIRHTARSGRDLGLDGFFVRLARTY